MEKMLQIMQMEYNDFEDRQILNLLTAIEQLQHFSETMLENGEKREKKMWPS